MNATVEIRNACRDHWVPSEQQCQQWLSSGLWAADEERQCSISLSFVDPDDSQTLNRDYRDKDRATNVLSFPAEFPPELREQLESFPLGDIVICAAVVQSEASEQNKDLANHWAHLTIHGLLHLLGYDHDSEAKASDMERMEINALERLGIPNPYLVG